MSEDLQVKVTDDAQRDQDYLLVQYQALVDRVSLNVGTISSNGLRRIIRAFVRAGVHELPTLKEQERNLLDDLLRMEDTKYALIDMAMKASKEEAEQLAASQAQEKENTNG